MIRYNDLCCLSWCKANVFWWHPISKVFRMAFQPVFNIWWIIWHSHVRVSVTVTVGMGPRYHRSFSSGESKESSHQCALSGRPLHWSTLSGPGGSDFMRCEPAEFGISWNPSARRLRWSEELVQAIWLSQNPDFLMIGTDCNLWFLRSKHSPSMAFPELWIENSGMCSKLPRLPCML